MTLHFTAGPWVVLQIFESIEAISTVSHYLDKPFHRMPGASPVSRRQLVLMMFCSVVMILAPLSGTLLSCQIFLPLGLNSIEPPPNPQHTYTQFTPAQDNRATTSQQAIALIPAWRTRPINLECHANTFVHLHAHHL